MPITLNELSLSLMMESVAVRKIFIFSTFFPLIVVKYFLLMNRHLVNLDEKEIILQTPSFQLRITECNIISYSLSNSSTEREIAFFFFRPSKGNIQEQTIVYYFCMAR